MLTSRKTFNEIYEFGVCWCYCWCWCRISVFIFFLLLFVVYWIYWICSCNMSVSNELPKQRKKPVSRERETCSHSHYTIKRINQIIWKRFHTFCTSISSMKMLTMHDIQFQFWSHLNCLKVKKSNKMKKNKKKN